MAKTAKTKVKKEETPSDLEITTSAQSEDMVHEVVKVDKKILLIPYLKSAAAGDELKYALRSWQNNYPEELQVVIVGDSEPWFSDEIIHIPHTPVEGVANPQIDVANKIALAITSGVVNGDFILSNDDIFLLGPTNLEFLSLLKSNGDLSNKGQPGGVYHKNAQRTLRLLEEKGLRTLCYSTHTPVVLNSEKTIQIIEDFKATEQGILLIAAYFNTHFPDARGVIPVNGGANCTILASVYRDNPPEHVLHHALQTRLFLNSNSTSWKILEPIFKKAYSKKSVFEK